MGATIITEWSLRASSYNAPEIKAMKLSGVHEGKPITTSRVVRKIGPMTYETRSGTHYRLSGPPEQGYADYCKEHGIELDLDDPIKFRAKAEDFQWRGL